MKKLIAAAFVLFTSYYAAFGSSDYVTAKVVSVIDGDTLKVSLNGTLESVRLIGIDTPESRINKRAKKESQRTNTDLQTILAMGKKAKDFTSSLVRPGDNVRLVFDVRPRDMYGRYLAYVYLMNGKMLNYEIISNGYAQVLTMPPNVAHAKKFEEGQSLARRYHLGLWK